MNATRVAYVCADPGVTVFGRKGCSIHVQEVIRALRHQGARVELFASRYDGVPPADLNDVPLHALPCPRQRNAAARERACQRANADLRRQLCAAGPLDVVYERYSLWSFSGMSYAAAKRVPGLLEINAPLIEEQAAHRDLVDRPAAEQIAGGVFRDATALIAVSDGVAAYLRRMGANPRSIHVIPNGVDPSRFPPDLASAWHRPGEKPAFTIGFVGTLKPWHGMQVLVEAFAQLHQRAPEARLLIVGEGPERNALEQRLRQWELEPFAHFTGAVAPIEVPDLIASMDVAVAPYPPLGAFYFSPLKVFEYMAAGRAVVASRVGQLATLIRHQKNGLLFKPGDAGELAAHLACLRADGALRKWLGEAARRTVMRGHTWNHVASRILAIAENYCASRGEIGETHV